MRKVKSLDLNFCPRFKDEVIELPHSLVTCDSLEVLKLFLYKHPLILPTVTGFLALRVLELNMIELLDDDSAVGVARDLNGYFPASLPNLKTLEISTTSDDYTMKAVIRILRCSPNLESLFDYSRGFRQEIWGTFWLVQRELDEVLARHLKRVEFLEFNVEKRRLDMARFLLEHGKELEEMAFSWRDKDNYHEKSTETLKEV
ncbi:hypothetical protein L1987_28963 [Smallanthus sonchifolius]|uniref:Uncharacterized protein n=1 Tax=Smallanthus sonchifolius TaxID=185202 RepID=A0ACB9HYL1_9ASTR|nr:hypothetical protein L1987_28963 [Smallanthus sonchifolius]